MQRNLIRQGILRYELVSLGSGWSRFDPDEKLIVNAWQWPLIVAGIWPKESTYWITGLKVPRVVMNARVAVCSGNCTFPSGDHAGECKSTALAIPYSLTQVTDNAIHSNAGPNGHETIDGRISKCNA